MLNLVHFLTVLPFALICLFFWLIFSRSNQNSVIGKILGKSKTHNRSEFIEAKKYEYDKFDDLLKTALGVEIAVIFGIRILGFLELIIYVLFSYVLVVTILAYLGLTRLHIKIIMNLKLKKQLSD